MFKKKTNKIVPVSERIEKYKVKPLKRAHKDDDLEKTYKLAQQLANEQADRDITTNVEIKCRCCIIS